MKAGHERVVPLAPELALALAQSLRAKLPTARVVLNAHGRTPGRTHVLASLKAMQRRAKLPKRSFHAADPVEATLADALKRAAEAGRFDVVARLAGELEARRLARAGNVVALDEKRRQRGV